MSAADQDHGLRAVRRVRAVREQDSRLGLARAVAEHQQLCERVETLGDALTQAAGQDPAESRFSSYAVHRAHLSALGAQLTSMRAAAEAARTVVESSREHWLADHRQLESVDSLLARRLEERRAEAAHRAAKEDDEMAVMLWRRNAATEGVS